MKKLIIVLTAMLVLCPKSYAGEENIALLTKKGFFETPQQQPAFSNSQTEVKNTLCAHLKYANTYNLEGLKSLYTDNYSNADGINNEVYFDLIKKTWVSYPDIKYKMDIKNIEIQGNRAVAQVSESALASTNSKSGVVDERGCLQSTSNSVYHLEKINGGWLISSDYVIAEKTFLRYGSAKTINVDLAAPFQIPEDTQYSAVLSVEVPKNSLIIASIGKENITYPQSIAEEVFRKLPEDGVLERVFKANDKKINEYAVASYGITQAEIKNGTEIKIYVTGLGFVMSRVNVIPKNEFVKVAKNEQTK